MDNQSAIQILKDFDSQVSVKADGAYQTTVGKMACDLAVAALEKQIPKKIIIKPVKNAVRIYSNTNFAAIADRRLIAVIKLLT